MFAFFKSFFESKLSNILADFTVLIEKLHAHATQELDKAEAFGKKAESLVVKQSAAVASASQAKAVAQKLTTLTSATP